MRTLQNIRLSIPAQAVIVIAWTLLWYFSWWLGQQTGKGFLSNLSLFWGAVFFFAPAIAAIFSMALVVTHFRANRSRPWLVYAALLFAVSPWICFWLFLG